MPSVRCAPLFGLFAAFACAIGGEPDDAQTSAATFAATEAASTSDRSDDGTGTLGAESEGTSSPVMDGGSSESGPGTVDGTGSDTGPPIVGCGDGELDAGEECDDANAAPCDGCEACEARWILRLDGADAHYVEVTDVAASPLLLLDTAFTVEAWARVEAGESVDVMRRGSGNTGWRLSMTDDLLVGTVFNGFDHVASSLALGGTGWHHIAWTYDGATSTLWLDGAPIRTEAQTALVLSADQPVRLGAWSDGTGVVAEYHAGRVDEIRVSTLVRYAAAFSPARRHDSDGGTVLLLHLDEGDGAAVFDASSHAHPGVAATVTWEPDTGYGAARWCE